LNKHHHNNIIVTSSSTRALTLFQTVTSSQGQPGRKANSSGCRPRSLVAEHFGSYVSAEPVMSTEVPFPPPVAVEYSVLEREDAITLQQGRKFQEEEQKKKKQRYDLKRNQTKISNRDKKVQTLPPLVGCGSKKCSCKSLVLNTVHQQQLRNRYVECVEAGIHKDVGNRLLLSYMQPNVFNRTRQHYRFVLPAEVVVGGVGGGYVPCCKIAFAELFGIGECRMKGLCKRRKDPDRVVNVELKKSGRKGFGDNVKNKLAEVLELYPREQSHSAPVSRDVSRKFYYSSDLNLFTFWCKYLDSLGTPDDRLFLEQSELKGYYPSYHYEKKTSARKQPVYTADDPQRQPSVSYSFARKFWNENYDIKFQNKKCGLCGTCNRLRCGTKSQTLQN